jgi:hypothetical protein
MKKLPKLLIDQETHLENGRVIFAKIHDIAPVVENYGKIKSTWWNCIRRDGKPIKESRSEIENVPGLLNFTLQW